MSQGAQSLKKLDVLAGGEQCNSGKYETLVKILQTINQALVTSEIIANVSQYGSRCGISHHTNLLPFFDRIAGPQRCINVLILLKAI